MQVVKKKRLQPLFINILIKKSTIMFKRIADRIRNTYNNVRTRVSNFFRKKKPTNKDVATAKRGNG